MDRSTRLKIDRAEDIEFQALSWYANDVDTEFDDTGKPTKSEYVVKVFGATYLGNTISVTVRGYTPYFYVKVPSHMQGRWTSADTAEFKNALSNSGRGYAYNIKAYALEEHKDLWGFSNDTKFQFIKIVFLNHKYSRFVAKALEKGIRFRGREQAFQLYESNIDPYIRMMHKREIEPSGWIFIRGGAYQENHDLLCTNCQIDIETKWKMLEPCECEDTAPFMVGSFDIECTSKTGDFPVPLKDYKRLATDLYELYIKYKETVLDYNHKEMIRQAIMYAFDGNEQFEHADMVHRLEPKRRVDTSMLHNSLSAFADDAYAILTGKITLENAKEKINREKIIQVLSRMFGHYKEKDKESKETDVKWISKHGFPQLHGDSVIQIGTTYHKFGDRDCCYRHILTLGTCDPVPNATVECCETEMELLLKWRDHIQITNPDVMTGYNIFGFDFTYMYERAKDLGIAKEFMQIGRFHTRDRENLVFISQFKESRLSSSALGDNFLKYIDMEGRVLIDLMKVVQRDHKLDSYKLDNVAHHFLGMNKNDVSPQEIFALQRGSSADRQRIAAYCIQDCALCNHLMIKLEIVANNMGMSNVCCVPLSFIFMRGQGIKIFSLVLKQCKDDGYLIPVIRPATAFGEEPPPPSNDDSYEGAIVLEPKKGIYLDAPISVLDYASLYPSSMISENLSPDSIVLDPKYDNLPGVEYLDIEWSEGKTARFVQPADGNKGVIPRILQTLLKARKTTRKRATWQSLIMQDGTEHRGFYDSKAQLFTSGVDGTTLQVDPAQVSEVRDTYNDFQKAVLDGLQNAYKVTANSLYGQMGARTSPVYMKEIAASTTATGRKMILMAKEYIEKNYEGSEVVYGDSVTGDSPLLLRFPDGHIEIKTIETLADIWIPHDKFKVWDDVRYEKEQGFLEAETWTTNGWAKIRRVIRHKTNKKIYRITTLEGSVDVTEDHSLLDEDRNPIKPKDCIVGETKLFHSYPSEFKEIELMTEPQGKEFIKSTGVHKACNKCGVKKDEVEFYLTNTRYSKRQEKTIQGRAHICKLCVKERACQRKGIVFDNKMQDKILEYHVPAYTITKFEAWVWGIFFGDGSCGRYECPSGLKYSWAINNSNMKYLDIARKYLRRVESDSIVRDFVVYDTLESSGVYKLEPTGSIKYITEKYRKLFYDKDDYKKVPTLILNAPHDIRLWFMRGYLAADGTKGESGKNKGVGLVCGKWEFACLGKIGAQSLYYLMRSLGWKNVRINTHESKDNTYWVYCLTNEAYIEKKRNMVTKMLDLGTISESGTYVYDLETDDGTFLSGIGSLNLKNTDSLFLRFKTADEMGNVLTGVDAIRKSRELGIHASSTFKKLIKPPHDLEFEKIFSPFILLSKKRYVGNKFEMDDHKFKQASMGIVLKRRDNANIVKKVYGGVIDIILNEKDINKAVAFLRQQLDDMINGKCLMEDLVLSKSLRAEYKDPTKIAHKVLAERIGDRDPGNKPQINDRIQFVYVEQPVEPGKKLLQGERIETPQYIREQNLKPDYNHYITNQIMKPLLQLFGIVVEQLPGYSKPPGYFELVYNKLLEETNNDQEKANDKLETLRENEVKTILFEPILQRDAVKPKRARKSKYDPLVLMAPPPELPLPGAAPLEEKPKPKRTRKTAASKILELAEGVPPELPPATDAPPPKPKRTRKVTPKTLDIEKDGTEAAEAAPAPPKPKRKTAAQKILESAQGPPPTPTPRKSKNIIVIPKASASTSTGQTEPTNNTI